MTKRGNPRKPTKRLPTIKPTPVVHPTDPRLATTADEDRNAFDAGFKAMMSATRNRCGTCRYFRPTLGKETGECRAELPQADLEDGGRAVWPNGIDPETGWCRQWETL